MIYSNCLIDTLFSILLIGFGVSLILLTVQENPVYMIFTFVSVIGFTYLFLLFQSLEFFALLILIIYTGVIAVLFLFTVIIYNLRDFYIDEFVYFTNPWFYLITYKLIWTFYPYLNVYLINNSITGLLNFDLNSFDFLYYYQVELFLLIACLLLLAMVGSVVITFSFYNRIL
jgi:NADH:ubiquinone oxidoreductase subunit 6 (subunit J)